MVAFPNQPPTVPVILTPAERKARGSKWLYRLLEAYAYDREGGNGRTVERILVPAGFHFDGASVPRLGWTLSGLTPGGPILAAAVVHDWLYRNNGRLPEGSAWRRVAGEWRPIERTFTRLEADQLFRAIMRAIGFRRLQIWMAYRAVRIGGRRW